MSGPAESAFSHLFPRKKEGKKKKKKKNSDSKGAAGKKKKKKKKSAMGPEEGSAGANILDGGLVKIEMEPSNMIISNRAAICVVTILHVLIPRVAPRDSFLL